MPANSANLSTAILALSPQLYYKFDEVTGTTIRDYGAYSANLTLFGGTGSFPPTSVPAQYTLAANTLIKGDYVYKGLGIANGINGAWANVGSLPVGGNNASINTTTIALVKLFPAITPPGGSFAQTPNTIIFNVGGNTYNFNFESSDLYQFGYNHVSNTYYLSWQTSTRTIINPIQSNNHSEQPLTANLSSPHFVAVTTDVVNKVSTFYVYTTSLNSPITSTFTWTNTGLYDTAYGGNTVISKITVGATSNGAFSTNRFEIGHLAFFRNTVLTKLQIDQLAANAGFFGNTTVFAQSNNTPFRLTQSANRTIQTGTGNTNIRAYIQANNFARIMLGTQTGNTTYFTRAYIVNKRINLTTANSVTYTNQRANNNNQSLLKRFTTANVVTYTALSANNNQSLLKRFTTANVVTYTALSANNNNVNKRLLMPNNYAFSASYNTANSFAKIAIGFQIGNTNTRAYLQANSFARIMLGTQTGNVTYFTRAYVVSKRLNLTTANVITYTNQRANNNTQSLLKPYTFANVVTYTNLRANNNTQSLLKRFTTANVVTYTNLSANNNNRSKILQVPNNFAYSTRYTTGANSFARIMLGTEVGNTSYLAYRSANSFARIMLGTQTGNSSYLAYRAAQGAYRLLQTQAGNTTYFTRAYVVSKRLNLTTANVVTYTNLSANNNNVNKRLLMPNNYAFNARYITANSFSRIMLGTQVGNSDIRVYRSYNVNKLLYLTTANVVTYTNLSANNNNVNKRLLMPNNYAFSASYNTANSFSRIMIGTQTGNTSYLAYRAAQGAYRLLQTQAGNTASYTLTYNQSQGANRQLRTQTGNTSYLAYRSANTFAKIIQGTQTGNTSYLAYRAAQGANRQLRTQTGNTAPYNLTYSQTQGANRQLRTQAGNTYLNSYRQSNGVFKTLQPSTGLASNTTYFYYVVVDNFVSSKPVSNAYSYFANYRTANSFAKFAILTQTGNTSYLAYRSANSFARIMQGTQTGNTSYLAYRAAQGANRLLQIQAGNTNINAYRASNGVFKTMRFTTANVTTYTNLSANNNNVNKLLGGIAYSLASNVAYFNYIVPDNFAKTFLGFQTGNTSYFAYRAANSFARIMLGTQVGNSDIRVYRSYSVNKLLYLTSANVVTYTNLKADNNNVRKNLGPAYSLASNVVYFNYIVPDNFIKIYSGWQVGNGSIYAYRQANSFARTFTGFEYIPDRNLYRQSNNVNKRVYLTSANLVSYTTIRTNNNLVNKRLQISVANSFLYRVGGTANNSPANRVYFFQTGNTNTRAYLQANSFAKIYQGFQTGNTNIRAYKQANNFAKIMAGFEYIPDKNLYKQANLVSKSFVINYDPMIDPTLIRPADAYRISYISY